MGYKLKIEFKGKYILVHLNGRIGFPEDALKAWKKIVKVCEEHKCYHILGIGKEEPTLSIVDAYNYYKVVKKAGIDVKYRVAWVEKDKETQRVNEFIADVSTNRAILTIETFSNISEAKKWLLREEGTMD